MAIEAIVIRTLLAVFIGAVIGREREINNRPAGIRTHALVCLGSAVIAMIQIKVINNAAEAVRINPAMAEVLTVNSGRIVAQVVSGIGFLGAGTIIINKGSVRGLTTAASLWVVACIGIAIGYGYYEIAIISGVTVPLVLVGMKRVEKKLTKRSHHANLVITFNAEGDYINAVLDYFNEYGIHVKEIKPLKSGDEDDKYKVIIGFMLYCRRFQSWEKIIQEVSDFPFVESVSRHV